MPTFGVVVRFAVLLTLVLVHLCGGEEETPKKGKKEPLEETVELYSGSETEPLEDLVVTIDAEQNSDTAEMIQQLEENFASVANHKNTGQIDPDFVKKLQEKLMDLLANSPHITVHKADVSAKHGGGETTEEEKDLVAGEIWTRESVRLWRLAAVMETGMQLRTHLLPRVTRRHSLSFFVYLIPIGSKSTLRQLFVFGNSYALFTDGHSKLMLVKEKGVLHVQVALPCPIVGRWVHFTVNAFPDRLQIDIHGLGMDPIPTLILRGERPTSFKDFVLGSVLRWHASQSIFANVTYENDVVEPPSDSSELNFSLLPSFSVPGLVESHVLPPPAKSVTACDMKDVSCLTKDGVQNNNSEALFFLGDVEIAKGNLERAFSHFRSSALLGNGKGMAFMAVMLNGYYAGIPHDADAALAWHLLAVAYDNVAESHLVLAFHPRMDFRSRLGHLYVAASQAFAEFAGDGFRVADYRPVEHLIESPEEKLVAKSNVGKQEDEMLEAIRYSAEGGDVNAMLQMGDVYYHGLRNAEPNVERAAEYFEHAAAHGDERAQLQLAKMHVAGLRPLKDNSTLKDLLEEKRDNAEFLSIKAHLQSTGGHGFVANQQQALETYTQAAKLPDASGQVFSNAGVLQRSVARDLRAAWRYFSLGSQHGDPISHYWMGEMIYTGVFSEGGSNVTAFSLLHSVTRHFVLTSTWSSALDCFLEEKAACTFFNYQLAAETGLAEASWDLGWLLQKNWLNMADLVDPPLKQRWLEELYVSGLRTFHRLADVSHGEMAMNAARFMTNETQALRYFTIAADQGVGEGIYSVGWANHYGRGCQRNLTRAWENYLALTLSTRSPAENVVGILMSIRLWITQLLGF